jgi:hypothetical protein
MSLEATYTALIGWSGTRNTGVFTIGVDLIGNMDKGLGNELLPTFAGPNDDVTAECKSFHVRRGKSNDQEKVQAGIADLTLLDKVEGGKYNPFNTASILDGDIKPMKGVKILATAGGISYDLFNGFLRDLQDDPDYGGKEATIHAEDMFMWADRSDGPIIAATGPTTVDIAISLILDGIEWPAGSRRALSVGRAIPNFSADGSKTALTLISELLEVDRGVFYVSRDGVATYLDSAARARETSAGTVSEVTGAVPGIALDNVKNRASVTRTGGVEQISIDTASKNEYGIGDWGSLDSPYFFTDEQAMTLANYLVLIGKDPKGTVWSLDLMEDTTGNLPLLLSLDLWNMVTIDSSIPGMGGDFFIEQIEHWGTGGALHRSKWVLSRVPDLLGFIIGSSLIGDTDRVLVY